MILGKRERILHLCGLRTYPLTETVTGVSKLALVSVVLFKLTVEQHSIGRHIRIFVIWIGSRRTRNSADAVQD